MTHEHLRREHNLNLSSHLIIKGNTIGEEANHTNQGHINPKPIYTVTVIPTALFHAMTPIIPHWSERGEGTATVGIPSSPITEKK